MSAPRRLIALHAHQTWPGKARGCFDGCVLLTEEEAVRLEDALRLARTGKLGKTRPVPLSIVDTPRYGLGHAAKTTLTIKGYEPLEEEQS